MFGNGLGCSLVFNYVTNLPCGCRLIVSTLTAPIFGTEVVRKHWKILIYLRVFASFDSFPICSTLNSYLQMWTLCTRSWQDLGLDLSEDDWKSIQIQSSSVCAQHCLIHQLLQCHCINLFKVSSVFASILWDASKTLHVHVGPMLGWLKCIYLTGCYFWHSIHWYPLVQDIVQHLNLWNFLG